MKKIENDNQKLIELSNKIKYNINEYITKSYNELTKNEYFINKKDIEKWKNDIVLNINNEINQISEYLVNIKKETEKINQNNNNIESNIEANNQLNFFISKDIQVENKEITRNFQNEAYNYMNANEQTENENVAKFLKNVAEISRMAYHERKKIFQKMEEKYLKKNNKKISINNEDSKKEFSCWVKNLEKEDGKNEYENILTKIELFKNYENTNETKFLQKLFHDLSIMYFHCTISFPEVEINFSKEENFNSDKMIDFINRGKNRKVNFIILPSLISIGNFLENGKSWVFTFTKKTFKFEDFIINSLNGLLEKGIVNLKYIKENLKVDFSIKNKTKEKYTINIVTNINKLGNIELEYMFHFINKLNKQKLKLKTKAKKTDMEKKYEIIKYEIIFGKEILISSKNIVDEEKIFK